VANPNKKLPIDLESLARAYTEPMIKTLGGYACGNDEVEHDIRLRAIGMLLDRGWGKPSQPQDVKAEVSGAVEIVLRDIAAEKAKKKT
jgi:hypothetical protein